MTLLFEKKIFYIVSYIFLVNHAGYVLSHLNYAKCPRLSVSRIILNLIFLMYHLYLFSKKYTFLSSQVLILLIYYIIILSCNLCPVKFKL